VRESARRSNRIVPSGNGCKNSSPFVTTVIVALARVPIAVAVTMAVPGDCPVSVPSDDTERTVGSLDVQAIALTIGPDSLAATTTSSPPTGSVIVVGITKSGPFETERMTRVPADALLPASSIAAKITAFTPGWRATVQCTTPSTIAAGAPLQVTRLTPDSESLTDPTTETLAAEVVVPSSGEASVTSGATRSMFTTAVAVAGCPSASAMRACTICPRPSSRNATGG